MTDPGSAAAARRVVAEVVRRGDGVVHDTGLRRVDEVLVVRARASSAQIAPELSTWLSVPR